MNDNTVTARVLADVTAERERQDAKWGPVGDYTTLPDGTGPDVWWPWTTPLRYEELAARARHLCDTAFEEGAGRWRHILLEEVMEALAESDVDRLRAELVQVAAVACRWVETIDARRAPLAPAD